MERLPYFPEYQIHAFFVLFLKREKNAWINKRLRAIFEFLFRLQNRTFFFLGKKKGNKKWEEHKYPNSIAKFWKKGIGEHACQVEHVPAVRS